MENLLILAKQTSNSLFFIDNYGESTSSNDAYVQNLSAMQLFHRFGSFAIFASNNIPVLRVVKQIPYIHVLMMNWVQKLDPEFMSIVEKCAIMKYRMKKRAVNSFRAEDSVILVDNSFSILQEQGSGNIVLEEEEEVEYVRKSTLQEINAIFES